ncbi:MAG: hypothetical protein OEY14_15585 [Myxococcales bacterium]|nr:hypothetical protein [Myxococcales bacterium]
MLKVDEFESEFRRASKRRFLHCPPRIERVLILSDLEGDAQREYGQAARELLGDLGRGIEFVERGGGSFEGVEGVFALLEEISPSLVCTYRNLRSDAWRWAHSLGVYLSALIRATELPVLITPNPRAISPDAWRSKASEDVMVITDHLVGDDALVSWGAALTDSGGRLHLAHMEHDGVYARYMDAISKISTIDTEHAREAILDQLLREAREYVSSCAKGLGEAGIPLEIAEHVGSGHRVRDFRALIEAEGVDVLVIPSLEEDTIALHGVSYSLAVELVERPLLMV